MNCGELAQEGRNWGDSVQAKRTNFKLPAFRTAQHQPRPRETRQAKLARETRPALQRFQVLHGEENSTIRRGAGIFVTTLNRRSAIPLIAVAKRREGKNLGMEQGLGDGPAQTPATPLFVKPILRLLPQEKPIPCWHMGVNKLIKAGSLRIILTDRRVSLEQARPYCRAPS